MPSKPRHLPLLLSLLLTRSKRVVGAEVKISSANDFKNFVNNVNSGTTYSGTTVYLDSDLSLSGKTLEPIGNDSYQFRGVFDGQGHIISNFKMTSYLQVVGLFGGSYELTIRNIVLDSSCSITSSYSGSNTAHVGGIIGYCWATSGNQCSIENSVSMADVTFKGAISGYYLLLGGIAGYLYSWSYIVYVKNCANYGSVTHSGTSGYSYIGGIVGYLYFDDSNYAYIQNSLNYGAIAHSGATEDELYIGGIVGCSKHTHIENCVSTGKISTQNAPSYSYIGSIVGRAYSSTFIKYCYYTSELGGCDLYGKGTLESASYVLSYDKTTFELNETASVGNYTGTSLISALNAAADYYFLRDYSEWLLNKNSKSVKFTINSRTNPIAMNYKIIILPSLATEGNISFDGWYNDNEYAYPLESFEITKGTTLYGTLKENTKSYTITFDTRGGSYVASITAQFRTTVLLPSDVTRDGCSFLWWETDKGYNVSFKLAMPAHNFTLYAAWKCTRIATLEDFIAFSKVVNSEIDDYSGATVLLDSDLFLTDKPLEPIGKDDSNYFRGTFDGQGHIISDLKINYFSEYTGLFGFSYGLTIRNVVLDSSCFITSSYRGSNKVYVGGIIGYCYTDNRRCNIENSVNIADVTFTGTISYTLYIGGISGYLSSYYHPIYVKNCANYGSVTHSGTSYNSYIGGIVGYLNYNSYYTYLYNCLNYGAITHSGTTSNAPRIGGIVGCSYYAYVENCVSAGEISTQDTPSYSYIGSIMGDINYRHTSINYCYYTSELSGYDLYGDGTPTSMTYVLSYDTTTFKLNETASVGNYTGTSLIGALNAASDYYFLRDYSKWLLNKNSKSVKLTINSRTNPTTMNYKIILLPSLANEGSLWFDGWYTDNKCANLLSSFEITGDTGLYGKFEENTNKYTITFDTRGGSYVGPITAQFKTTVILPSDVTRDDCTFLWWETDKGYNVSFKFTVPARNFTLYAVWKCTHITLLKDFIAFSKVVNSGTDDFSGATVYLDSDLSLSGKTLEPIGKDDSNYFRGTFDGQGHIISDLKMNISSSQYTGLFGYSKGLTIRNVVLDSSCSISSSYKGSNKFYVGGIIGYCYSSSGKCNIENNVNMAAVIFSGNISGYYGLYLGGVAGELYSYDYNIYVKNCANYGPATHSGISYNSYIGGIVGYLYYRSFYYTYLYNCLNYGSITHSGTTSNAFYIGGIAGHSEYTYIENCVSAGRIYSTKTGYVGSIVGYVDYRTYINYCYYTNDVNASGLCGYKTPESTTGSPESSVSVNSTLVSTLNSRASDNDWNDWLLNTNNASVSFIINNGKGFAVVSQVILLPSPVTEGRMRFDGWYNDSGCTNPLESFEIIEDTTLYGILEEDTNNYTITFDTRREGVSVTPITAQFKDAVILPSESIREHCSIAFWETEDGNNVGLRLTIPANNFSLYAVWKCTHIATLEDFNDFSKLVNSGTTYSGTTVYLESDLSLSGKTLVPIGASSNYLFLGTFDGQGHIISNLKMSSSSQYTGLFGYSKGLTIKNVVLDSSCSITSSFSGPNDVYVGGTIGECYSDSGQCNIENSVNMVDVTFSGTISNSYSYLGGIAGYLYSWSYNISVKNCANYGSVTHSGASYRSYIGGIVGDLSDSTYKHLYNCLNYGTITHSGTTTYLYIGGIAGHSEYTYIENFVSAGKIYSTKTGYVGSIMGYVNSNTYINNCYYTSGTGVSKVYDYIDPASNVSNTPNSPTNVNLTLINNLNNYASENDGWNKWLLNMNSAFVAFRINNRTGFSLKSQIILLPDVAADTKHAFSGWYKNTLYNEFYKSDSATAATTLYGLYGAMIITVTFDPCGGAVSFASKEVVVNNTYGELPEPTMEGYSFYGWFTNSNQNMTSKSVATTASNHTLYAHWTINKYALTFNFNNGTDPEVSVLDYNASVNYPEDPVRKGYNFLGWDKNDIKFMPAQNLIITAQWISFESSSTTSVSVAAIIVPIFIVVIIVFVVAIALLVYSKMKKHASGRRLELSESLIKKEEETDSNSQPIHKV